MPENRQYGEESAAVQAHLNISQSVIQRMATNSSSCKAWCITLVSAILVIVADKGNPNFTLIAGIPTVLFFTLDAYYLALERCFRESYNSFIEKLHAGNILAIDLYAMTPSGSLGKSLIGALRSFSTWPFYLTLAMVIWIAKKIVT